NANLFLREPLEQLLERLLELLLVLETDHALAHHAIAVDEERRRDSQDPAPDLLDLGLRQQQAVGDTELARELCDFARVRVEGDADHDEPAVFVLELLEAGHLLAARRAPGR